MINSNSNKEGRGNRIVFHLKDQVKHLLQCSDKGCVFLHKHYKPSMDIFYNNLF